VIDIEKGNCRIAAARDGPVQTGEPGRSGMLPGAVDPKWTRLFLHHSPKGVSKLPDRLKERFLCLFQLCFRLLRPKQMESCPACIVLSKILR